MIKRLRTSIALMLFCTGLYAQQTIDATRYGIRPDTHSDVSPRVQKLLKQVRRLADKGEEEIIIRFAPGKYDFYPDKAAEREYYISNHDQDNPKRVEFRLKN